MIFCKRCGNYAADGLEACPKCTANLMDSGHPSLVGGVVMPAPSSPGRSSAGMAGSSEPAGHVQRFVALVIDSLLQGLIMSIGLAATLFIGGTVGLLILAVVSLVVIAYEPYFIAAKGATPGKNAMGLRVIGKDGGSVGAGQSVARFVLKIIFNELFIPLFVPLFSDRRRALHDMVAGTYVVRA